MLCNIVCNKNVLFTTTNSYVDESNKHSAQRKTSFKNRQSLCAQLAWEWWFLFGWKGLEMGTRQRENFIVLIMFFFNWPRWLLQRCVYFVKVHWAVVSQVKQMYALMLHINSNIFKSNIIEISYSQQTGKSLCLPYTFPKRLCIEIIAIMVSLSWNNVKFLLIQAWR